MAKKYYQEAVIINFNDIDIDRTESNCDYTVQMVLKAGKSGVKVKLPDNGSAIKGFFAKSN